MTDIHTLREHFYAMLQTVQKESELEEIRLSVLGKKGTLSALLKNLSTLSGAERQKQGAALNSLKSEFMEALSQKKAQFQDKLLEEKLAREKVDISLPVRPAPLLRGRIHPITQVIDEISAIFAQLGFSIAEGPDIETAYYNFTALNFPEGHPAREMHDTFFLKQHAPTTEKEAQEVKLLRTHTSPVQVRTMEKQKPPLRIIIPGKTYRMDSDATHTPMFHQLEGLVVDKKVTIAHMMWLLEEFCKRFFEVPSVKMRFRPSFFPFTEPSMEVDIQCERSKERIKLGEGKDWLEILGCGMVHPHVLKAAGLCPETYQGFAWGLGIDRIAMLKYGMADLRAFFESDSRWLHHFGFYPFDIPTLWAGLSR